MTLIKLKGKVPKDDGFLNYLQDICDSVKRELSPQSKISLEVSRKLDNSLYFIKISIRNCEDTKAFDFQGYHVRPLLRKVLGQLKGNENGSLF